MRFHRGGFSYRLARMLAGRNGPDTLYYVLFALALICSLSQWFFDSIIPTVLSGIFIFLALFRCFSRNVARRQRENAAFCAFFLKLAELFRPRSRRIPKTHVFRKCKYCKSKLRLRYVKGKHSVRCPRCNGLFDVKIR